MAQPRCTAKTRGSGGTDQCKLPAMVGTTVCRKHGGKLALASIGSGNIHWKDGRRSAVWKDARLRERYEEHINDPDMLQHRDEVAVLDALLDDAIGSIGIDAGTADRLWAQANSHMIDFEIALRNGDRPGQQSAFVRLREVVREGQRDASARTEARTLVRERSSVAERETRRILSMKNVLTGEQAYILFHGIMTEINETVKDPDDRARLNNRLMRLAGTI